MNVGPQTPKIAPDFYPLAVDDLYDYGASRIRWRRKVIVNKTIEIKIPH